MTTGPTMQAVTYHRFGPPAEVLACETVAMPNPKPSDLLVRIIAAPINPSELLAPEVAERYHRPQIESFAAAGADRVTMLTATHTGEPIGIVRAAVDGDGAATGRF